MIEIISHRGYWHTEDEKNRPEAFRRSFDCGFGTETDVRDHCGQLVISHDPPVGNEMMLEELLGLAKPAGLTLAINIKSDGLARMVAAAMREYPRWFAFDMSVPDMLAHVAAGNATYTRVSELERDPVLIEKAEGIWADAFHDDDWRINALYKLVEEGRRVCLVSPELHKRAHEPFWGRVRDAGFHLSANVMLCTDFPEAAAKFFGATSD